MHAGDEFPEGSMEVARIEIVRVLSPKGKMLMDWTATGPGGKDIDEVTLLGLLEMVKIEIHESTRWRRKA